MKTILVTISILLGLTSYAGDGNTTDVSNKEEAKTMAKEFKDKTPDERSKNITDMLDEKLKLTQVQYKNIYDINVKYANLNDAIFNKGYGKLQLFSKLKSVNSDREKEIKAQLDKQQLAIFEHEKSAMISQFKSMRK